MTTTPFLTTSSGAYDSTAEESSSSGASDGSSSGAAVSSSTDGGEETEGPVGEESGEGDAESEGEPVGAEGCEARCEVVQACEGEGEDCFFQCVDAFDPLEEPCIEAVDALNRCIGEFSCDDYEAWLDPSNPDPPCADAGAAVAECEDAR